MAVQDMPFDEDFHREVVQSLIKEEDEEQDAKWSAVEGEPFVVKELLKKAAIYGERNKLYGDNYKRFGAILTLILANQQLDANDPAQMGRLGIFVQLVAKMTRYGNQFTSGGHDDSLDDLSVYSMMLKELDAPGYQFELPF